MIKAEKRELMASVAKAGKKYENMLRRLSK